MRQRNEKAVFNYIDYANDISSGPTLIYKADIVYLQLGQMAKSVRITNDKNTE
jgi:hypothetical protein